MIYDVLIIGAGVSGCAVARELSRCEAEICVLERGEDVCSGTSKANSAIVHAGYDCLPGSVMARMNLRGNEMMESLSETLDFPFRRNGSMVICIHEEALPELHALLERGIQNGVSGLRILSGEEALAMEPNLSENLVAALYAPSGGIVCPFGLNIALAENANVNGVDFFFNTAVEKLSRGADGVWQIRTENGLYRARCVVNAAGVYADLFHNMVSRNKIHITPRRGEYMLLDREVGGFVSHTIFPQPTRLGKGVLISPTVHGNLIVGPTAADIEDRDGVSTTQAGLDELAEKAALYVKNPPLRKVITSFAGLRAHEDGHDFILGEPEDAPGFVDCAGIESPGLTSAPAIGEYLAALIKDRLGLSMKKNWTERRRDVTKLSRLSSEEKNLLIKKSPEYGQMVCRCESVTEGEILEAIRRPLGARSLDAVKRRTRAGFGRCQAGFCTPRVMEVLSRELGIPEEAVTKSGRGSELILGCSKEVNA